MTNSLYEENNNIMYDHCMLFSIGMYPNRLIKPESVVIKLAIV
ncbi:hypothetical protein ETAE_2246 [Edwardsiella piscicida]|uniref:Uncharacterized protein n=2 Tax=Edwardsiella TaxID=635 RepID=A0AAU8PE20_EDWPI|nr:hypothetical protein ETAE_2246 [Edwardsiella tarda EIB202]AIJ06722.1 Hypothetical protein ETEE_0242 [Edwardsiella anguillarum ET080813]